MAEQNKEIHIVFQVNNFLKTKSPLRDRLLQVDMNLLRTLACHHGPKGIFPCIDTLATEVNISPRYVKERLSALKSLKLIDILQKKGRSNQYRILFVSTNCDSYDCYQCHPEEKLSTDQCSTAHPLLIHKGGTTVHLRGEPQFQKGGTTVHPINIDYQYKRNNIEGKRVKARSPTPHYLPDDFEPSRGAIDRVEATGLTEDEANLSFEKFLNYHKGKGTKAVNWQLLLINWFIDDGVKKANSKKIELRQYQAKSEIRSTVPWWKEDPMANVEGEGIGTHARQRQGTFEGARG